MNKIIFLGAGSKADPNFEDVFADSRNLLSGSDIKILYPPVIESCHGCPDLMSDYSEQMQSLVEKGDRVVGVLAGGLIFALPSMQATQTTYPIISCPLDNVAYQAFMVPSGNAVVGSVGVENKVNDVYQTKERKKAMTIARNILELKEDKVSVACGPEILEELKKFAIKTSRDSKIILNYSIAPLGVRNDEVQLWSDSIENLSSDFRLELSKDKMSEASNTLQVRGKSNLVYYAARSYRCKDLT